MRDILRGDPQAEAVAGVIASVAPDIIVLQGIDYDLDLMALRALRDRIDARGHTFPHAFALSPNTGRATGLDMDGDGKRGEARDAQGYGPFAGEGGMAILSRFPVDPAGVRDFSDLLWADLPWARLPSTPSGPFPSAEAQAIQRLSTTGHWLVPVKIGGQRLTLLTFHASPPAFDGPEDRNGLRNHDEIVFWRHLLDGSVAMPPVNPFVLLGVANLDPVDGGGHKAAILDLLNDPRLQDPRPMRPASAHLAETGQSDPRLDTASWPAPGPGDLRVSYILPSAELDIVQAGVHDPPSDGVAGREAEQASRHRLVWIDLHLD
ncbi:endonuclease/exonuclease/phosphatase family protein [Roseovarius aestuariivivens]|uniref:endonuclease/exonuclease/phosphatase family protein n=1 Tax=Roseovarius aestuariivivens TaxID=1888910 RepID=UPI001FDA80C2|nr:endonuclease/exonuclease/phosphatase family protein [Roseovarius aestuariivivens]